MLHSLVIHVVRCLKPNSRICIDMVETRAIRRARELLKRNRCQFELGDRTEDFYYYSSTYHQRTKKVRTSKGPPSYSKQRDLTRLKVILNSVQLSMFMI